jgi:hypothetical protein
MRLNLALLLLCSAVLTACGGTTGNGPDAGTPGCTTARDCPQTPPQVCVDQGGPTKVCVIVCTKNADCASGKICEDGTCNSPGCGGDSDCGGGMVCSSGQCTQPTQASGVGSCFVTPNPAVVHAGNKLALTAVVKDLTGTAVPFKGVTWAASAGTIDASGVLTAGATAGTTTVTASAGTKTCTSAITVFAAATTSQRVVVTDSQTKKPIAGAFVVIGNDVVGKKVTDASGVATFDGVAAGARDVHAFAANYNYASYLGTTNTDVLISLPPSVPLAQRSGYQGTITTDDFAKLNEKDQIVHLAFFGSGVTNSILDFSVDTLVGPSRHVVVKLAGDHPVDLPSGLVIGVADDLFQTGTYKMYSEKGKRVLWGLGGNIDIAAVLAAAGPLINGGTTNIDVGALLPQLLPLLGKLQAGAIAGVEAPDDVAAGGTPTFQNQTVPLNTPLRLRAAAKAPDMPKVDGEYVDGIIALAGTSAFPMGFVPLGLTAGLAAKDANGKKTAKVLDPTCDPKGTVACNTSNLPIKLAAANNGLEGNPYGTVLIALNFGGLTPGSTGGIAVSGLVKLQNEVKFTSADQTPVAIDYGTRQFMTLPNTGAVTFSKGTRKVVLSADADASVQIYRFEVENSSRLNWNVWMDKAGAGKTVTLFDPHTVDGSLVDPMADANASARLIGIVTTDAANNYTKLTGFGDLTLDNIGNNLSAFSVITIPVGN